VKRISANKIVFVFVTASLLVGIGLILSSSKVKAATATWGLVRLDRMRAQAVATGGTVCLNPSSADNGITEVAVTFSNGNGTTTGFTLSGTASTFNASVTNLPSFGQYTGTAATALPNIDGVTPVVAGQTITYTIASTNLTSGTVYCFNFGAGLTPRTTPASDLTGTISTNGSSTQTATYATATLSADQIAVTATVPQMFNFALNSAAVGFGNLSTSTVNSQSIIATIGTNANTGWVSWVRNSAAGLYSTVQTSAIAVPTGSYGTVYDLDTTTGYVLDVDTGTGTPTIDTAYDGDSSSKGGIMTSLFRQIAFKATPGTADTFTLNFRAKIAAIQPAASDYADTVTVAAAGEY
jgi:hypothetical protein